MKTRIFWGIVAGFLLGVFARTIIPFGWATIGFCLLLACVILISAFAARMDMRAAVPYAIALIAFTGGSARMHMGIVSSDPLLDVHIGEKIAIEGVVSDEPDVRENNIRVPVRITSVASSTIGKNISALVIVPLHTDVVYGDEVHAEGELRAPEGFETGNGHEFDYPGYLAKDGILYELSFAHIEKKGGNSGNSFKAAAVWMKQEYLAGLANALAEPQAGLAGGITVGDKRGLGAELSDTFRIVGLTHVIVLSGYNITVVIDAIFRMLSRAPQVFRLSCGVFVAVFFAAITGFASASTRAAAMAIIAVAGKATGRIYLASRALAVVALGMVLWNPYVLVFDPGFQLSILATMGLILFSPFITPHLGLIPERFGLREIAASSMSAQLAVLPLLLYQNGKLSLFALPVNLLSLAVIPMAMLFSAIAALIGLVAGAVAPVFGLPAYVLLSYVIYVAKFFATLPFSSVSIPAFSTAWLLFIYMILFGIVLKKHNKAAGHKVPPHR